MPPQPGQLAHRNDRQSAIAYAANRLALGDTPAEALERIQERFNLPNQNQYRTAVAQAQKGFSAAEDIEAGDPNVDIPDRSYRRDATIEDQYQYTIAVSYDTVGDAATNTRIWVVNSDTPMTYQDLLDYVENDLPGELQGDPNSYIPNGDYVDQVTLDRVIDAARQP